jgi:hypothetical protein
MPITEEQRLARNAKARERYAKKKAENAEAKKKEEKQKKLQTLKDAVVKIKAGQTIVGAIKRKLATPKPKKKEDDNRLHNLPEDLQKKIMLMTKRRTDKNMVKIELPMKELVKYLKQFPNVLSFIAKQGYTMQDKVPFRYKPYLKYNLFIIDYDDGREYVFKVDNSVDEMYSTYLYDKFYRKSKKGVDYDIKGLEYGSAKGSSKGSNVSKVSSRSSGRTTMSSSGSSGYTSSGSSASPISGSSSSS